jgi:hypothetical protein
MKEKASDIVYNLARSESLIDIEYSPKLIDILKTEQKIALKLSLTISAGFAEQTDSRLLPRKYGEPRGNLIHWSVLNRS